jgi:hypothetical protein
MRPRKWRASSLSIARGVAIVACACIFGCGARRLHTLEAPPDQDAGPVAPVDPTSALPKPTDFVTSNAVVATLRAPVPPEQIAAIVHRLFQTFHERSTAALEPDLDDVIADLNVPPQPDQPKTYWVINLQVQRLKTTSFDQLEIDQMYDPQQVEVYAREELGQPGRPPRPPSMGADDVLVRIPVATPRVGADVLFGDEIKLLLRRVGETYKIHGYGEIVPR